MAGVIVPIDLENEGVSIRRALGIASGLVVILDRDDPAVLEEVRRAADSGVRVVVTAYRPREALCAKSCKGKCDWCEVFANDNVSFVSGPDNIGKIQQALGLAVTAGRISPTRGRQGMPPGDPYATGSSVSMI